MAATSSHGLFSLFSDDKPLLSCHDLNIVYCVNPEESVGRALFKQIMVSLLHSGLELGGGRLAKYQ